MGNWETKSTEYRKLAASAQGVSVKELKAADLANYFLANGIDYKGQTQMGVIASTVRERRDGIGKRPTAARAGRGRPRHGRGPRSAAC